MASVLRTALALSLTSLPLSLACTGSGESESDEADSSEGVQTDEDTSSDDASESDTSPQEGWVSLRKTDESEGAMMSVWGPSPDEVYVVGGQLEPNTGTVLRFDGSSWTREELPPDTPMLHWVYGVDDRVWAVGRVGTIVVRDEGGWSSEVSPTDKILWGIWGASADELWAVGGDGVSDDPVLVRREGSSGTWSTVTLPELGTNSHALFKIWGTSATDIWAVGDLGSTVHWDGSAWTAHPSEAGIDLISLWGSPSEGIVAAGGRANAHIGRLAGETWTTQTLEHPGLNGVWVDPTGPITMVGVQGTILSVTPGSFEVVEEQSGTPMVLHAVFGFAGGRRFAVGGTLLSPPPYSGIILGDE